MKRVVVIVLTILMFSLSNYTVKVNLLNNKIWLEVEGRIVEVRGESDIKVISDKNDSLYLIVELNYNNSDSIFQNNIEREMLSRDQHMNISRDFYETNNKIMMSNYLEELGISGDSIFYSSYTPMVFIDCKNLDILKTSNDLAKFGEVNRITIYEQDFYIEPQALCFLDANGNCVSPAPDYRNDSYDNFDPDLLFRGLGIKIGLLDIGGFDEDHPNFVGIYTETVVDTNFLNDTNEHPTMVASVLGGKYGIASKASIFYTDLSSEGGIFGIESLVDKNVDVINVSAKVGDCGAENGFNSAVDAYFDYISYYYDVVIVAAAGNYLDKIGNDGSVCQPASSSNVISVGSIDENGNPSHFSSYKTNEATSNNPVISAVGENRYVEGFGYLSGTSFSSPAVTGTVALLFDKFGTSLSTSEIISLLTVEANESIISSDPEVINILEPHELFPDVWVPSGDDFVAYNTYDNSIGYHPRTGSGALDIDAVMNYDGTIGLIDLDELEIEESYQLAQVYLDHRDEITISCSWETFAMEIGTSFYNGSIEDFNILLIDSNDNIVAQTSMVYSNNEILRYTADYYGYYTIIVKRETDDAVLKDFAFSYKIKVNF